MARIRVPKSEEEIKKTGVGQLRNDYNLLASDMTRILEGKVFYCHRCDEFHSAESFYTDSRYASGLYPDCKKSLLMDATDYDKKTNTYVDNKEKTKAVFQRLDLPFIDSLYRSALSSVTAEVGEKNRQTAYQQLLVMVKSLPQYRGWKYAQSEFDEEEDDALQEEINENSTILKRAKKRFGKDYIPSDLLFLENEYQDWIHRYECNTKAQEEVFENLSIIKLLKIKALKDGKPTKDLDKQQQDWLDTGSLKPKQNMNDTLSDAQTFGTLLQKWEETRPLPEIDPELEDVDKIGVYFDAFVRGHTLKMLGLKNSFSNLYERVMQKYTVTKPEYNEEEDSEVIFERVFGGVKDE